MEDDQIPISFPVTLANGDTVGKDGIQGHVKIGKGTYIHIPIEGFSLSEDVWGKDALSFKYVFLNLPIFWTGLTIATVLTDGPKSRNGIPQSQV